ncbi:MAG: SIR2 family protein [Streptococcus salivarius]|nr:SIR2 family protein [Streptococcus salivarius]
MIDKYISNTMKLSQDGKKYFKNERELLNDKEQPIEKDDFDHIIKDEIFSFINPFDNIVLLAGAGASVVPKQDGKPNPNFGHTVAMLGNEVKARLVSPTYYTIDELSEKCRYNSEEFNLEDFLSHLQAYLQFISETEKEKKFKQSYDEIIKIIKQKTSYDYDSHHFKHATLIKQLTELLTTPNRLSIVTTNYDTIVEDSAYSLNYTVFDGFTFSHKPAFDVDMFDWYLSKPIPDVKSQKEAYKKSVINLLKIHGSLTWEQDGDEIIRKDKNSIKEPIMVFPSSNKYMQSYERPYFELFSKFQALLRKQNTVLITAGFSFADNHISRMIIQALKTIPSLSILVTDFDISSANPNKNWNELIDLMKKDYNIAFLQATMNSNLTDYFIRGNIND